MRTSITILAVLALLAGIAEAGTIRLKNFDSAAAPGGSVAGKVELANDGSRPAKFRVKGRLVGDADAVVSSGGRLRGKLVKRKLVLGPGESLDLDLDFPVPAGVTGAMKLLLDVRGPDGRETIEQYVMISSGDSGKPDDPFAPPQLEDITGTVTVVRAGEAGNPGDDTFCPATFCPVVVYLEMVTTGGETWECVGPEAHRLARLMLEAGLASTSATLTGIKAPGLPTFKSDTRPEDPGRLFWVVDWEAEGVVDPADTLVPHRYVMAHALSRVASARGVAIRSREAWETLLASAGIRLPEDLPPFESPPFVGRPEILFPWQVDFDRETVLAIFAGEKLSSGYFVEVASVAKRADGTLEVKYGVGAPGDFEPVIEVPTSPFAIVAIPKTDREVVFTEGTVFPKPGPGDNR